MLLLKSLSRRISWEDDGFLLMFLDGST
jgi:hypothetical protein